MNVLLKRTVVTSTLTASTQWDPTTADVTMGSHMMTESVEVSL